MKSWSYDVVKGEGEGEGEGEGSLTCWTSLPGNEALMVAEIGGPGMS